MNQGERVRLTARGVIHIAWGTHTICGRKIPEDATGDAAGALCRRCRDTPVMTFTFQSGRRERYYAR